MKARVGKIARLPGAVRDELNRRLHDGFQAKQILPWLNALPEANRVLTEFFGSRPLTEDNLSEWRRGGFQDWRRDEERRVRLRELAEECQHLSPEESAEKRTALLQERLTLELMEELERLSALEDRHERWKRLQKISQELCRLQRTHLRGREVGLFQAKSSHFVQPNQTSVPTRSAPLGPNRTQAHRGEGAK